MRVRATTTWSVYREDDGPLRAYKFFGQDLYQDNPSLPNTLIDKVMSTVVQDHIANHTLDEVIKKRDELR